MKPLSKDSKFSLDAFYKEEHLSFKVAAATVLAWIAFALMA